MEDKTHPLETAALGRIMSMIGGFPASDTTRTMPFLGVFEISHGDHAVMLCEPAIVPQVIFRGTGICGGRSVGGRLIGGSKFGLVIVTDLPASNLARSCGVHLKVCCGKGRRFCR